MAGTLVKVGGSLYDLPSLRRDLTQYLVDLDCRDLAIFPGGGRMADVIRDLDVCHGLGDERSHFLAVQSLSLAAQFLCDLLGVPTKIVSTRVALQSAWKSGHTAVIDPMCFSREDAGRDDPLPHCWEVTSDTFALQVARRWRFDRLTLLKSTTPPPNWADQESCPIVDPHFRHLLASGKRAPEVTIVNLREIKKRP